MPKRTDIASILIIGAGPIVIGQAAEFDYSGTQAVKALKGEGYRVILVNSNPATIMTDPELADATYIEPLTVDVVEAIIAQERPDALLPTVGGQTALNLAVALAKRGVLQRHGVELIGASLAATELAEDRLLFRNAMTEIGLASPQGGLATTVAEARALAAEMGRYPILIRPSFTLGGSGGAIVYNEHELQEKVAFGLSQSPVHSVLVEESILGWKEYELEVMRDHADNFVVVCSIENLDPMGVHTGDSITVAPAMTLTDREYQRLRDQARAVVQAVGVNTGGANVQFAVNPADGRVVVIEMNPRVSRSSALASKATGFPIAKFAALLAVGYTLDELQNDITQSTVAAFEPSIDYVVTKLPRWAFEKFPGVDPTLGTQMKSVGEAMAIGRTFKESLLKGLQSLELNRDPFPTAQNAGWDGGVDSLALPRAERIWALWEALRAGHSVEAVCRASQIDRWFVAQLAQIVALERAIAHFDRPSALPHELLRRAKRAGFCDRHIAYLLEARWDTILRPSQASESNGVDADRQSPFAEALRTVRQQAEILPTFHRVDTCAAEFEAHTPYLYSAYERESEVPASAREKVIILGSGPNRIGQGIEFDYCCTHAAWAMQEAGYEAIMVNCNPETVSTDYDTSDRLYFEPLTLEHVLNIVAREQPLKGVVVQFGGQTPLGLAHGLAEAGVPILGTQPDAIDLAEDRARFATLLAALEIPAPPWGVARSMDEARQIAAAVGYPVIVRPSYVLGGRAMAILYDEAGLARYLTTTLLPSLDQTPGNSPTFNLLIDRYLGGAIELDVDAVADGERVVIGGIMAHIEEAGIHSGDSSCVIPPHRIPEAHLATIRRYTERLGKALSVCGLMNLQFAIHDDTVYVLEVNPRASRTIPYVSKAVNVPLARIGAWVMTGATLAELGLTTEPVVERFFVKEAVFPFKKFLGVDAVLGPEMKSTGEVMGHGAHFGRAFAKAQLAAGNGLPTRGTVFISVNDSDKPPVVAMADSLQRLGFHLIATRGTAAYLSARGLRVALVNKVSEGPPNILHQIENGEVQLVINTPQGSVAHSDGRKIRAAAIRHEIPLITTLSAVEAAIAGIKATKYQAPEVTSLQAYYRRLPHR